MSSKTKGRPFASRVNDVIGMAAPRLALRRELALTQRQMLMSGGHYEGAGRTGRGSDFRVNRTDAIEAGRADRGRLAWLSRDMMRNNPRVVKAQRQLVNRIVGPGITPNVVPTDPADTEIKTRVEALIRQHCMTTAIDADGLLTLPGLQALICGTTIVSGEGLSRVRLRRVEDGLPLPFQIQVLEPDYLNDLVDGRLPNGNLAVQGVEFNGIGRRLAYHLFAQHPGGMMGAGMETRRVSAEYIMHVFDVTRPGQVRGISWMAPVVTLLHELQKYQDAQIKRQEMAAMFAATLTTSDSEQLKRDLETLSAGAIMPIRDDESMEFNDPPGVDGYEPFMRGTDRTIAGALGLTYEGFSGDYSNVNYSSGRMGRLDTDPTTTRWQRHMMVAQFCTPLGKVIQDAVAVQEGIPAAAYRIDWTPPRAPLLDPTIEIPAAIKRVRGTLGSLSGVLREMGEDSDAVMAELAADMKKLDALGLTSDSDARRTSGAGVTQARPAGSAYPEEDAIDE